MKDKIKFSMNLHGALYIDIKSKAKEFLNKGIEKGEFVSVDEFNCRYLFELILIEVAKKRKLTVIIGKDSERIAQLQTKHKYAHIYNPVEFAKSSPNRPNEIIVSDNISIENLRGLENDVIVGGFYNSKRNK
ncbi:hypothetical protein [Paenibacillus donghaensis]|uniref:Uncharacterized protein n=1 Tax=Paenibacillus donghaensis TaxID=414771 RepID=A0A2Z2KF95_9BACL|nr:hypothetical protein [Paenibacillus donghaensis]ASA21793.1 hypothetical protein B9T62_14045 [Paenibacillus donghaensis]